MTTASALALLRSISSLPRRRGGTPAPRRHGHPWSAGPDRPLPPAARASAGRSSCGVSGQQRPRRSHRVSTITGPVGIGPVRSRYSPHPDGTDPAEHHHRRSVLVHCRRRRGVTTKATISTSRRLHPDHCADHDGHEHQGGQQRALKQHAGVAWSKVRIANSFQHTTITASDRADHDAGAQIRQVRTGRCRQVVPDPAPCPGTRLLRSPHRSIPVSKCGQVTAMAFHADLGQTGDQIGPGRRCHHHGAQDRSDHGAFVVPTRRRQGRPAGCRQR